MCWKSELEKSESASCSVMTSEQRGKAADYAGARAGEVTASTRVLLRVSVARQMAGRFWGM